MKNNSSSKKAISIFFVIAALYDGILGLAFLIMPAKLFEWFKVTPPNHFGYVHFPAALLIIFALMFLVIAKAPIRNRNLIPYGILLKVSFCGVAGYHWLSGGVPDMWKPFAVADLVFLVLFVLVYRSLPNRN